MTFNHHSPSSGLKPVRQSQIVLGLIVSVFLLTLFSWQVLSDRARTLQEHSVRLEALAVALAENAESLLRLADSTLHTVEFAMRAAGGAGHQLDEGVLHKMFLQHQSGIQTQGVASNAIWMANAEGVIVASSLEYPSKYLSVTDRPYYIYLKSGKNGQIYINPLTISRIAKLPSILVAMRMEDAKGNFIGVLGISLRADYFDKLYPRLQLGSGSTIALVREDGKLLYRYPFEEQHLEVDLGNSSNFTRIRQINHGSMSIARSAYDNRARLAGFMRGNQFPVVAIVSELEDEVFAQWRRNSITYAALGLLAYSVMVLLFAYSLRQLRQVEAVTFVSLHDTLTGIYNRRYFDQHFAAEWSRIAREQGTLTLLFIDVDHFKKFNDYYGHKAGDHCLRDVAQAMNAELKRPGDVLVRYGGEEFVCILPNTDQSGGSKTAQNIIDAVRRLELEHLDSPVSKIVTISVGLATTQPRAGDDGTKLLNWADTALYAAKEAGRNCVSVSTHLNGETPQA